MPPRKPPPPPTNPVQVKIAKDIARAGWAAVGVMPTEDEPIDPFTYTIGLFRSYDHPELIITGMHGETAHAVLAMLIEDGIDAGASYEAGQEYPDLLAGRNRNYPAAFRQVTQANIEDKLAIAGRWNAFEEFPALQLVYPDPAGKFPWEDGYDRRHIQPLLSTDES